MGKTTLARGIRRKLESSGIAFRVLDPNGTEGGDDPEVIDPDEWMQDRITLRDARGLFLDDGDDYLPPRPARGTPWRKLYLRHAHLDVDVLVTARRPQSLSPMLWSACRYFYLFWSSSVDFTGLERLREIVPRVPHPSAPYRFVRVDLLFGWIRHGIVRRDGSYILGEPFRV